MLSLLTTQDLAELGFRNCVRLLLVTTQID